jgi:tetratricopeptide (TPR) repeat protein
MVKSLVKLIAIGVALALSNPAWGSDDGLRITIPKRSQMSPVQRLNREGVDAINRHAYQKAEGLFYKAYLYDPADPFTLNNLGYVSELKGQMDRAQKFYALAAEQGSEADIDRSNVRHLEGKPMKAALADLQDGPMRVNEMNINALRLLSQDRGFEAATLLRQTLSLDPQNPFTLNNLGVADEAIGNYDDALKYYRAVAAARSAEPVVVALDSSWRGRPVSKMAADNAKRLQARIQNAPSTEARAAELTLHGVYAVNQNDWAAARQDFIRAYSLNPTSAFSLNNRGYVAEKDGDLETAEFFYQKARRADDSDARVGLASALSAQRQKLSAVAAESTTKVDNALDAYSRERRRETAPIELTPRDNSQMGAAPPNPQ